MGEFIEDFIGIYNNFIESLKLDGLTSFTIFFLIILSPQKIPKKSPPTANKYHKNSIKLNTSLFVSTFLITFIKNTWTSLRKNYGKNLILKFPTLENFLTT
jgi:hypothetical protein